MRQFTALVVAVCLVPLCWCTLSAATVEQPTETPVCCETEQNRPDDTEEGPADCRCCLDRAQTVFDKPDFRMPAPNWSPAVVATVEPVSVCPAHDEVIFSLSSASISGDSSPPIYLIHQSFLL